MFYFKILEAFILRSLFNKDEYNFKSKFFNPIKLFTICLLTAGTIFNFYLINKLADVYLIIKTVCPKIISEIETGSNVKIILHKHEKKEFACN